MHAQQDRSSCSLSEGRCLYGPLPRVTSWFSECPNSKESGGDMVCVTCRFSDLNLPPKNWTFPCTVATLGEIKVRPR